MQIDIQKPRKEENLEQNTEEFVEKHDEEVVHQELADKDVGIPAEQV